jgi:hypothetical protein
MSPTLRPSGAAFISPFKPNLKQDYIKMKDVPEGYD